MTTMRPTSIDDLAAAIPQQPRWVVRGGGTKSALAARPDGPILDLSGLAGIVAYTPEECTFTALGGTRLAVLEQTLAAHGQYLPFDPPLVAAGATIGGTVAAGINGSCRYRFGGIRDFIIGARIADGEGRVIHSGGTVVKNAAGFLLHQAMVGSGGTLGVIAEVTFKVFPAPEVHATVRAAAGDLATALTLMTRVQRARFDLEAVDITPPGHLVLRIGGAADAIDARVSALVTAVGGRATVLRGDDDVAVWREAREFSWARPDVPLVRVPVTLPQVRSLDHVLTGYDGARRYTVAGNLAWISWDGSLDDLAEILRGQGLEGRLVTGPVRAPALGAVAANPFESRLRAVMDPCGRFAPGDAALAHSWS